MESQLLAFVEVRGDAQRCYRLYVDQRLNVSFRRTEPSFLYTSTSSIQRRARFGKSPGDQVDSNLGTRGYESGVLPLDHAAALDHI